jgi:hypothetical protein
MNTRVLSVVASAIAMILSSFSFVVAGQPLSDPKQQTNLFGSSGGNVNDSVVGKCCSGTLGSLVSINSKKYILSNNHVIGMMGKASKGDPISQPGLIDNQCKVPRSVGKFTIAAPITSNVDAGIAELIEGTMDSGGSILGIGTPSAQIVAPAANVKVQKSGRSSGVTHGMIQSYSTDLKVDYSDGCKGAMAKTVPFTNQIVIVGNSGAFSASGDSGSLVLTESKNPVGLLFAGSSTLTVANPIKEVLDALSKIAGAPAGFGSSNAFVAESAKTMQFSAQVKKALVSKEEISSKLIADDSVIGIGVSGTPSEPEVIVYVQNDLSSQRLHEKMNSVGIKFLAESAEYNGTRTTIIKTGRFRAFGWNEPTIAAPQCHY